ncbi:hypothetical protein [Paenibacillus sp. BR1-192]|uniref:hypothetical protein n=1 Tax=Paenibacillus sp. BR1-192 TaxID=3032287 RepID=UPI00240D6331|nr:hypothetical protein [Paenibacillus sp. BR1-192]WFB60872.1 hypothetical protein P0X86_11975 [Paenibacillus sp. BR1-192]
MTLNDLPELEKALATAIHKLNQAPVAWLLGGSCCLLLQGVELGKPPRDIDIYADAGGFSRCMRRWPFWQQTLPGWIRKGYILPF